MRQQKISRQATSFPAPQPGPLNPDALLDVKQMAELMSVSERTIWRLSDRDPLFPPKIRLGVRVRWRVRDYNSYLERRQLEEAGAAR